MSKNIKEIKTEAEIEEFMTEPTPGLIEQSKKIKGSVMALGATGKMGMEMMEMLLRADKAAGVKRRLCVASGFSNPENEKKLNALGIETFKGDLSSEEFIDSLPEAENVFFMAGFKFGSSGDYTKAYHMNIIMPYICGRRYKASQIVAFSSSNFYPHTPVGKEGPSEESKLDPQGIYGWTLLGREQAFRINAQKHATKCCFYRLAYAQHFKYGVVVDICKAVMAVDEFKIAFPYVNLISQRDANDAALKCLSFCENPPRPVNVSGPAVPVREIAERAAKLMNKRINISESTEKSTMILSDRFAEKSFGPYRDSVNDIIDAIAAYIAGGGKDWGKPTGFTSVNHKY